MFICTMFICNFSYFSFRFKDRTLIWTAPVLGYCLLSIFQHWPIDYVEISLYMLAETVKTKRFGSVNFPVTRLTKQAFSCSKFLSPGGQLWANTAFEGSLFYSIGVPKFYSWVNVISVYVYNDLG